MDEPRDLKVGDWILKARVPSDAGPHRVFFLIHGWTGDEKSMWVFASRLPRNAILIAPRAPYVSKHPELGGYSWVPERGQSFSSLAMFQPALASFETLLPNLAGQLSIDLSQFSLVGFSQGAAFSFAYAMGNPSRVSKLAALAGFLPAESGQLAALSSIPIFIAHGAQDETVPVAMARQAHADLEAVGVAVRYCESETGHKLGANCSVELQAFFTSRA
ncbi:MAG TPA: dienelactone hydrolase family protein [Anaerolineales bacterium]|jgi:phospholipase/carboxylesterase|nr:dienelactone hydrolase family protein [Anaerolineales bacterium]